MTYEMDLIGGLRLLIGPFLMVINFQKILLNLGVSIKEEKMIQIANPIYDVVFKYLLDDNKEVKIIVNGEL